MSSKIDLINPCMCYITHATHCSCIAHPIAPPNPPSIGYFLNKFLEQTQTQILATIVVKKAQTHEQATQN